MNLRWEKLRRKMEEENLDAFLITKEADIFYFSGIWTKGCVLFTNDDRFIITTPMYREESLRGDWEVIIREDTMEDILGKLSQKVKIRRCGFEASNLPFDQYQKISVKFKGQLIPQTSFTQKIRAKKEDSEIEFLTKACKLTLQALDYIKEILQPGISEKQVVGEAIKYLLKEADGFSFFPIVLFGERTSLPHGSCSSRSLKKGDLVLVDIGAKFNGYCADLTRTFIWGENTKWEEIKALVQEIQQKAIQSITPGEKCSQIDGRVREKFEKAGFKDNLLHGTGHGVGLEIHEYPSLTRNSDDVLEEKMIITVEPGVYFPGKGGIRLEEMVLITNEGGKVLP